MGERLHDWLRKNRIPLGLDGNGVKLSMKRTMAALTRVQKRTSHVETLLLILPWF